MAFLDENYLLGNRTARDLYKTVAELPVIDAHNHADVKAICDNRNFPDIWAAEASTDHYVWSCLRKRGVDEKYITGPATNLEKWLSMANVFDEFLGSPTYEWIHLDLKRRLGIDDQICAVNGQRIWDRSFEILARPEMQPQELLKAMNVTAMCSTDDPVDSLEYHQKLASSPIAGVVRPTFRPDKAMNIFRPDWNDYIAKLEKRVNGKFKGIMDLLQALQDTHDYFAANGCVASDHGVETPYGFAVDRDTADRVFKKAREGRALSQDETVAYMSYLLNEVAEMDAAKGWVFQLHIGAVRDIRDTLFKSIGPDCGCDISSHTIEIVRPLRDFLNRFDNRLKVILYCLEPGHQASITTLARAFGRSVSLGSAWWLNDSPVGMKRQLEYIGSVDMLYNFAGMVSDSRKLLSYGSRTEMFRRVLCDVVGNMVELGQVPLRPAEKMVQYLSYQRPRELFGL